MSYQVDTIDAIGDDSLQRLVEAGVRTTGELLIRCGTGEARSALAERVQVPAQTLLEWAHMADLMRIPGVGRQYAELLDACGVGTVIALRTADAGKLEGRMREVNAERQLAKTTPSSFMLARWIDQARNLPPRILAEL